MKLLVNYQCSETMHAVFYLSNETSIKGLIVHVERDIGSRRDSQLGQVATAIC